MSYYATFDDDKKSGGDVATNLGWNEFVGWVEGLAATVTELRHLTLYGWSQEIDALDGDLAEAMKEDASADVLDVAKNLRGMIEKASGAEVIVVTDGAGVMDE